MLKTKGVESQEELPLDLLENTIAPLLLFQTGPMNGRIAQTLVIRRRLAKRVKSSGRRRSSSIDGSGYSTIASGNQVTFRGRSRQTG
jgi:hypothetical protein